MMFLASSILLFPSTRTMLSKTFVYSSTIQKQILHYLLLQYLPHQFAQQFYVATLCLLGLLKMLCILSFWFVVLHQVIFIQVVFTKMTISKIDNDLSQAFAHHHHYHTYKGSHWRYPCPRSHQNHRTISLWQSQNAFFYPQPQARTLFPWL